MRYAGYFYNQGENILESQAYKVYIVEQVFSLKAHWESQDIPQL